MPKYVPFEKFEKLERRLRRIVRRGTEAQRRDALAVVLGLHGLRVSEVVNLTVDDFDPIDETLRVITLKKGRPRRISLGRGVALQLKRLAHGRTKSEPLLRSRGTRGEKGPVHPNQWERFARKLTKKVLGGDGLPFHCFRHTHGIRTYAVTKDMQRVRSRLGHVSIKNTDVYVEQWGMLDDRRLAWIEKQIRLGKFSALPSLVGRRRSKVKPPKRRRERDGSGKKTQRGGSVDRTRNPRNSQRGSTHPAGGDAQENFGRTILSGERELFETTGKPAENTTKAREPSENARNAHTKSATSAKRRTKATSLPRKRSGERTRKSKD